MSHTQFKASGYGRCDYEFALVINNECDQEILKYCYDEMQILGKSYLLITRV